jgi:hypothetical protein
MKQFYYCPAKRSVQAILFRTANITGVPFTGVSGPDPQDYLALVKRYMNPSSITLYDTDAECAVNAHNPPEVISKCANIFIDYSYNPDTPIVDLDCYGAAASNVPNIQSTIFHMNRLIRGDKVIFFIMALRPTSLAESLKMLNRGIYDNTLEVTWIAQSQTIAPYCYAKEIEHTQSRFSISKMYQYKDHLGGLHMLSGMIKWNN